MRSVVIDRVNIGVFIGVVVHINDLIGIVALLPARRGVQPCGGKRGEKFLNIVPGEFQIPLGKPLERGMVVIKPGIQHCHQHSFAGVACAGGIVDTRAVGVECVVGRFRVRDIPLTDQRLGARKHGLDLLQILILRRAGETGEQRGIAVFHIRNIGAERTDCLVLRGGHLGKFGLAGVGRHVLGGAKPRFFRKRQNRLFAQHHDRVDAVGRLIHPKILGREPLLILIVIQPGNGILSVIFQIEIGKIFGNFLIRKQRRKGGDDQHLHRHHQHQTNADYF